MNRENLLLSFLYANDNEKVEGTIKLMKQLFLVENQKGVPCFYNFEAYDLGPVSFQVYSDLTDLKNKNVVREEKQGRISIFSLTPTGILIARDVFNSLDNITKDSIIKIKKEFNQKNKDDVVLHVYKNFPKFTFRSKYNALLEEIIMTLAIFLECKNGVVVASDTQSTIGDMMKRSGASKINKINDQIIWAGSGDEAFLSDIDDEIRNLKDFNFIRDGMTMEQIKEIISDKVYSVFIKYKKRYDKLVMEPPTGTMIIATFGKGNCLCNGLLMTFTGTAYKINEGYEAIGSSKAYAEVLLKSYYDGDMDFEKGIRLSHWIINQCSKTDLYVNENITIYIIKMDNNKAHIEKISDEKITELNNVSEQTTDVFRSIYHQMDIASLMNLLSENSNKDPSTNFSNLNQ